MEATIDIPARLNRDESVLGDHHEDITRCPGRMRESVQCGAKLHAEGASLVVPRERDPYTAKIVTVGAVNHG